MSQQPLITARNLSVHYPLRGSLIGPTPVVRAVENVTIEIAPGSFLAWWANPGPAKPRLGAPCCGRPDHPGGRLLMTAKSNIR